MDPFAGPPEKRRAFDDAGQNGVQRDRTCKRFDTPEGCPFGDRCRFSHGPDDPRFKGASNGAGQKQPCSKFYSTNGCPYGDTCHFTHHVSGPPPRIVVGSGQTSAPLSSYRAPDQDPSQGRQGNLKTRICKNYQEGNCSFGDRCHFAHGDQDIRGQQQQRVSSTGFTSSLAPIGSGAKEFPLVWGDPISDAAGNVTHIATITFQADMAGSIIGKAGANVKQIQISSGAKVTLKASPADPVNLKDVDIEGTPAAVQSAGELVQRTLADRLSGGGGRPGGGTSSPFYKTRLCEKFMQGQCTFGDKCHFAHGEADLRTRTDQPTGYGGVASYQTGPPGGIAAY